MSFHYKYGGSTAKRTLNCPGWRALSDTVKRVDKGSEVADRGTMLHTCCEVLEDEDIDYEALLERNITYNKAVLTPELLEEKVIPAMEALDDYIEANNLHTIITEELLEYSEVIGGTPDILGFSDDVIACADYKFGDGIMVYAEDNDQMFFCVWLALDSGIFTTEITDKTKVSFAIIQPSERREETLDVWETTVARVNDFGEEFLEAVDLAEKSEPGENLDMGEWCTFCPAESYCPKKTEKAMTALRMIPMLEDQKKNTDTGLQVLDLNEALVIAKQLEPWIKAVRSFAFEQLEAGANVEGWKLVDKRPSKKWIDSAGTAEYLKRKFTAKNAMVSTVISPAQAEKMAKKLGVKVQLKNRIISTSSGTTIAPESDKREAIITTANVADALKQLEG